MLETAEALFHHIFRNFCIPEDIVSDRGPQFISRVWRGFFHLLGVTVSLPSGYHPQTNGQTERKIQDIGQYLRTYCHEHQDSWSQYLPWAEYAQNSLRQETTGLTLFQRILCYQSRRAIRSPHGRLLVLGERECMGLSPRPFPTGSSETQDPSGCPS